MIAMSDVVRLRDITARFENGFKGISFSFPNSVAVLQNGNIAVADGGLNQIVLVNVEKGVVARVGKTGYGKYRFKEPVGIFIAPTQVIFLADWHNHRLVGYDSKLNYLFEFGEPAFTQSSGGLKGALVSLMRFAGFAVSKGAYIQSHFSVTTHKMRIGEAPGRSIWIGIQVLQYWFRKHHGYLIGFKRMMFPLHPMNKPNGVAFIEGGRMVVSQKNSRTLCVYQKDPNECFRRITVIDGPVAGDKFGRLANLHWSGDTLYVCDEESSVIWCFDKNLLLKGKINGADSGIGTFAPFSCCMVRPNLLAVCGGRNVQLIDTNTLGVVYTTSNFGEVHGVAYDENNNRLYVADRGARKIRIFEVLD